MFLQALTIYEQAKQSTTACNVQTYTEALDVCVKSKSIAGMLKVMEDMRIAGCSPNAVTCSVVLIALSSKCSGIGEALQLIESLEGFDSKLVLCCQRLLAEVTKTDRQVHSSPLYKNFQFWPQKCNTKVDGYIVWLYLSNILTPTGSHGTVSKPQCQTLI